MTKKYITGYFLDETDLKAGIKKLQENNIAIEDVRTPFPVHGLEKVLKYRRSHLPKVAFFAGMLGAAVGLSFQIWVFTYAWPMNIGGKPFLSIPSFIPVTFELTVLFAAFTMGFAFLYRSGLGLGAKNPIFDARVTDDHFQIVLSTENDSETKNLEEQLSLIGAQGITIHA